MPIPCLRDPPGVLGNTPPSGWGHSNFKAVRVAFVLAAITVWFVGRRLNSEAMEAGDDASYQAFGLPMQRSGLIVAIDGFVLTLL